MTNHLPRLSPTTLRGVPAEMLLRSLAEPVAPSPAPAQPKAYMLQHVAAGGSPVTSYKMSPAQVRKAIRTYTGSFAHPGERLHVRDAAGTLVAAYRAESGRWIVAAAFEE